jgi:predicted amidohydrolase
VRIAAIQLDARVGDIAANLEACERLALDAVRAGAEWVILPEFFTTGVAFLPELADAALRPDGEATALLTGLAREHGITAGGSFLCRDDDGHARNAFFLARPDGLVGRHDKDLPTMWENAFYVGGSDDGVMSANGLDVGVAMCWELMRTQTVRRLRERVDIVVGGSCWWSQPDWPPRAVTRRREAVNERQAVGAAPRFTRFVGAPVVHAAHCGRVESPMPWSPLTYRGHFEGGASVSDAQGRVLAFRDRRDGEGFAVADVEPGRTAPAEPVPHRFWLHRRDPLAAFVWNYQRAHGRRWYERHAFGRPPALVGRAGATVAHTPS